MYIEFREDTAEDIENWIKFCESRKRYGPIRKKRKKLSRLLNKINAVVV